MDDTDRGMPMGTRFTKQTGETLRAAGALSTVGLAFVFALVIGFWFGTVLDGWRGTRPVFTATPAPRPASKHFSIVSRKIAA